MPVPPYSGLTSRPVPSAPTMPPMQWMPNTSRLSSYLSSHLMAVQKNRQTTPATTPSMAAPIGPTKPAAGVTATRPATTPETRPSSDIFHLNTNSMIIQDSPAAAVATNVFIMARPAPEPDSRAEPALKPNQPTHNRAAPTHVK